jgi:hypothetical protein
MRTEVASVCDLSISINRFFHIDNAVCQTFRVNQWRRRVQRGDELARLSPVSGAYVPYFSREHRRTARGAKSALLTKEINHEKRTSHGQFWETHA